MTRPEAMTQQIERYIVGGPDTAHLGKNATANLVVHHFGLTKPEARACADYCEEVHGVKFLQRRIGA